MRRVIAVLMLLAGLALLLVSGQTTDEMETAHIDMGEEISGTVVRVDVEDVDGRMARTVYVQSYDEKGKGTLHRIENYPEDIEVGASVSTLTSAALQPDTEETQEASPFLRTVRIVMVAAGVGMLFWPASHRNRKRKKA